MVELNSIEEICKFLDGRVKVRMPKFVESSNWGTSIGIKKQVSDLGDQSGKIYYATGSEDQDDVKIIDFEVGKNGQKSQALAVERK